jgi:endo-1,4-beta-xylanase
MMPSRKPSGRVDGRCGPRLFVLVTVMSVSICAGAAEGGRDWVPLRTLAGAKGLLIGAAVKFSALENDPEYRALLRREYSLLVPENELKWATLRPDAKSFAFEKGDAIVDFAVTHGLAVRGHTLCWNLDKHMPRWVLEQPRTPAQARDLLRDHIRTVMARYQGRIKYWDVVNEAVTNNNRTNAPVLADGYWRRMLGDDYVQLAFKWAHEADPDALLFYNDYDKGDSMGAKSDRIYVLVKQLVEQGVPIHGVGLQMHCNLTNPPVEAHVRANFQRLTKLGLQVHITELDVDIEDAPGSLAERLAAQGRIYGLVTRAAAGNPDCTALVTWGVTDRWGNVRRNALRGKPEQAPTFMLPFDAQLRPKPAAFDMAAALRSELTQRRPLHAASP